MATESIPAVVKREPHWNTLHLSKNYAVMGGAAVAHISGSLSHNQQDFLAIDEAYTQMLGTQNNGNTHKDHDQLGLMFGEEVTRADGSTWTVLAILDEIAENAAAEAQANPAPSAPQP